MPSTTLKRTAATLGVLAGLLATAGPASAMPIYMKVEGVVSAAGTQVGSEGRAPQGQYDKASPFTAVALSGPAVAASVPV